MIVANIILMRCSQGFRLDRLKVLKTNLSQDNRPCRYSNLAPICQKYYRFSQLPRWNVNKICIKAMGIEDVDWIYLACDRVQKWALINAVTSVRFQKRLENFWLAKRLWASQPCYNLKYSYSCSRSDIWPFIFSSDHNVLKIFQHVLHVNSFTL
jgi:hypothetical protein